MNKTIKSAVGLLTVAYVIGGAPAASAAQKPASLPDWGGVWENLSGIHFTQPRFEEKDLAPNPPPLTPEYQAKYDQARAASKGGRPINDPTANCAWPGTPRIIVAPFVHEYLITPGRVTIIYEYMSQVRRVRTDGSKHPADLDPSYNGDSIGHWEGNTLVIDTVGLRADTMFENTGLPHSDALHVVERIHLTGPDDLVNEMTFEDAKALAKPWKATWRFKRHRDWSFSDYVCSENNRNPSVNGVTVVK